LEEHGLFVESIHSHAKLQPKTILSGEGASSFDVILFSTKSSMQRDMEKGLPVEAGHLQGYLYNIAKKENINKPIL
jgi:hypothetical protein